MLIFVDLHEYFSKNLIFERWEVGPCWDGVRESILLVHICSDIEIHQQSSSFSSQSMHVIFKCWARKLGTIYRNSATWRVLVTQFTSWLPTLQVERTAGNWNSKRQLNVSFTNIERKATWENIEENPERKVKRRKKIPKRNAAPLWKRKETSLEKKKENVRKSLSY